MIKIAPVGGLVGKLVGEKTMPNHMKIYREVSHVIKNVFGPVPLTTDSWLSISVERGAVIEVIDVDRNTRLLPLPN